MARLFSNPHKEGKGIKAKVLYFIRGFFYTWLLKKYCDDDKTVIDVACGHGQFLKTAKKMGFDAEGIDADERYKSEDVMIGDLWTTNKKYDVVFNSMILEHMPDHEKFINKMASLSTDIVITLSAYPSRSFWNTPDHTKPVTKVSVRWLFRRAGFRNLLSIHIPFYKAVAVVSKKVKDTDVDEESLKIKSNYW